MFILYLSISLNYLQDQENNEEACLLFATKLQIVYQHKPY